MTPDLPTWAYHPFCDILDQAQASLSVVGVTVYSAFIDLDDNSLTVKVNMLSDDEDADPDGPMFLQYRPDLEAFHAASQTDPAAAAKSEMVHLVLTLTTNALAAYQSVKGPLRPSDLSA